MAGQAARRGAVSVERFARNLDDANAPDNAGALRRTRPGSPRAHPNGSRRVPPFRPLRTPSERREFRRGFRRRRRIRLQPSLFRRAALPARHRRRSPQSSCICPQRPSRLRQAASAKRLTRPKRRSAQVAARSDDRSFERRRHDRRRSTLGVDGGATRCRARLRDADGKRSPRRAGLRRISMLISPPRSRCCARSSARPGQGRACRTPTGRGSRSALGLPEFEDPTDAARVVEAPFRVIGSCARRTTR